jgi:hypothetical protein
MHKTEKRLRLAPLAPALAVIFAAVLVGCPRVALAALACGVQPEFLAGVLERIKGDAEGKAGLILQAPPRSERNLVTAQRRDLRQKYAEVDKSTVDRYLLWVTCQTISNDPTLAETQKFDEYSNVYRLLSEPIDKAASSGE